MCEIVRFLEKLNTVKITDVKNWKSRERNVSILSYGKFVTRSNGYEVCVLFSESDLHVCAHLIEA